MNYGADSARLFILSDSPPEKDVSGLRKVFRHHSVFEIMEFK